MTWSWEVAERDHEIQDPTSAEKIRLLGEYLRLDGSSRVVDLACGKAGPAIVLAEAFGCRIQGVELRSQFADEARARIAARGLDGLISIETADAADYPLEPEAWDAALCLGASFVWGHIGDAARVLAPAVRPGGFVAIGEPFWREAGIAADDFVDLPATVERFQSAGVALTGLIAASRTTGTATRASTGARSRSGSPPTPSTRMLRRCGNAISRRATTTSARSGRASAGRSSPAGSRGRGEGRPCPSPRRMRYWSTQ